MCPHVGPGKTGAPIATGQIGYRENLPATKLSDVPELEELIGTPPNNHWIGPHAITLSYFAINTAVSANSQKT